jgi:DNA-binding transcriptional regulator YiaG
MDTVNKRPRKCMKCRAGTLAPTIVDYSVKMEHDGRVYPIQADHLEVLRCTNEGCKSEVLPDHSLLRLNELLRLQAGLFSPNEIVAKRSNLGLSQKDFAHLLGVATATVSRWETGAQIQQRVMNDFMRAFFDLHALRVYLMILRGLRQPVAECPLVNLTTNSVTVNTSTSVTVSGGFVRVRAGQPVAQESTRAQDIADMLSYGPGKLSGRLPVRVA